MPGRLVFVADGAPRQGPGLFGYHQLYDLHPPIERARLVANLLVIGETISTVDEDMILVVQFLHRRGHPVELYAESNGERTRIRLDKDGEMLDALPNRISRGAIVEALLGGASDQQVADLLYLKDGNK